MKTKNKKPQGKTLHLITFDDSKFGHEIEDSWGFHMTDAMWYCQAREEGYTKEECYAVWKDYQDNMMKDFEEWVKNNKD